MKPRIEQMVVDEFDKKYSASENLSFGMYQPMSALGTESLSVTPAKVFEMVTVPRSIALGIFAEGFEAAHRELEEYVKNTDKRYDDLQHRLERMVREIKSNLIGSSRFCVYCNDMHSGPCREGRGLNHPAFQEDSDEQDT